MVTVRRLAPHFFNDQITEYDQLTPEEKVQYARSIRRHEREVTLSSHVSPFSTLNTERSDPTPSSYHETGRLPKLRGKGQEQYGQYQWDCFRVRSSRDRNRL